ncbi:hypothetical protein GCM10025857_06730 [Alicyclobacillus contaminans]|uniref:phage tail protein n=1 Tax=Alicyclobacillus contaminans TaxID=392016 RepID=UPI000413AE0D|nr:hypothetical protein [Alicyclobacillus contaminans]GMA49316.1 hypothetical protein GCM10025857_06730 [Alicyclobacillus contaminans]
MADDNTSLVIRLILNAAQFAAELDKEEARLDELDAKKLGDKVITVRIDDAEARAELARDTETEEKQIRVRTEETGGGGGFGIGALLTALPALSPLLATATAGAMGLASAFTAAVAGAGGLAAVAVPTIHDVITATQQGQKGLQGLDAQERQAAQSLLQFEMFWKGFTQSFQSPVLNMFTNGLKMLQQLLTDMRPIITAAAQAFTQLESEAAKALGSPFWQQFFTFLGTNARPMLVDFGEAIGNLVKGFAALLMAFQPLSTSMAQGLLTLTQRFAAWATSLQSSQGFQQFLTYVRTNGPMVVQLIGQLASIAGRLLVAWAPLGHQILQTALSLATFVNQLLTAHPQLAALVGYVITGVGAFKLFGAGISSVSNAVKSVSSVIKSVQQAFEVLANVGKTVAPLLSGLGSGFTSLLGVIRAFSTGAIAALRAFFVALMSNPVTAIITLIVAAVAAGTVLIITHWREVSQFLTNAWNALRSAASSVFNAIHSAISSAWNAVRSTTSAVWNAISSAVSSAWSRLRSVVDSGASAVRSVLSSAWNAVRSAASSAWNGITSVISNAAGHIRSALGSLASEAFSWGKNLISEFVSGISSMLGAVGNAVSNVAHAVARFLGFHSPAEEGPGAEADVWAPNLMKMFAQGITEYTPMVQAALSKALTPPTTVTNPNVRALLNVNPGSAGAAAATVTGGGYAVNGPLLHIENLTVRNDQDIQKIQQGLYNANQNVLRGMGIRQVGVRSS